MWMKTASLETGILSRSPADRGSEPSLPVPCFGASPADVFPQHPGLLAVCILQPGRWKWGEESSTSSLDGKMLIEGSSCSLPSQDSLASCQLMIMNTTALAWEHLNLRLFPHNEPKARNNSTHQTGEIPVVPVPRQTEPVVSPGNGLPLCRTVCVHPPHLLSAICISHLGPVPLGKFPTPVHLSLRGWSSCRASSCEGQHGLLQQRAGTKDSVSFLLPAPPEAAPSSGPGQGRAGWGPGTRTGTGTGSISLVRAACCVLSQLVLLLKQREQKEKFYSHHKILFSEVFLSVPSCVYLRCSCVLAKQRSKG